MRAVIVTTFAITIASTSSAHADRVQADLGLSVVAIGYEQPVSDHVAIALEGGLFGTYFLPWFDLGDNVIGAVGGVRGTWFARTDGSGLYITPYLRAGAAGGKNDGGNPLGGADIRGDAGVITTGIFAGWVFQPTAKLDLRVGAGAQYIYFSGSHGLDASTPFIALDFTLGWKL